MIANEKWIVLLDGEMIDQVDGFSFATSLCLFTEDSPWCHYYAIEGGKILYRRVRYENDFGNCRDYLICLKIYNKIESIDEWQSQKRLPTPQGKIL